MKAASRHQDNLSVAERARAGEQEELHALVHTTCLFPPCAQVLFFFTLSHLCKMEEESELDRLLELEREVFSEGEGEETWSVIRSAELADTPSKSSSSAAQGSVAPRRVQESSAASKVLQAREYEQALQGCLLRAAKRPKIEMPCAEGDPSGPGGGNRQHFVVRSPACQSISPGSNQESTKLELPQK